MESEGAAGRTGGAGPRQLDRYELLVPIGSGGMATVYLGRAVGPGGFERLVAVKVCHAHLRERPEFAVMFLEEARLAARIRHPNVVATLDVRDDDELYIVMDYVEGGHLADVLRAARKCGERLPLGIALRAAHDALEGLHAAHELEDSQGHSLNLVHRDVSPHNILLGVDGLTRIVDFGIAKAEERVTSTRPGEVKGKFAYMAPEQLGGQPLTRRVDVFASGVVLWEALAGRRLFKGESTSHTLSLVLSGPILRPSEYRPEVPAALDEILLRALDRDPSRRFATAKELAGALEGCGVELAPTSEVGAYVEELLAERLEPLRAAARAPAHDAGGHSTPPPPRATPRPTPSSGVEPELSTDPGASASRRRRLAVALLAVLAVVALLGLGAWLLPSLLGSPEVEPSAGPTARQPASSAEGAGETESIRAAVRSAEIPSELAEDASEEGASADAGLAGAPAKRPGRGSRPRGRHRATKEGKARLEEASGEEPFDSI